MGAACSFWMPRDHRIAIRLLGKGISTPHALAYLRDLSQVRLTFMRFFSGSFAGKNDCIQHPYHREMGRPFF